MLSALPPLTVQARSTVVPTFVAPLAGATAASAGTAPQLLAAAVKVCTGVETVSVASQPACATTTQNVAPRAVVSKNVCVVVPAKGGGLVEPRYTSYVVLPAEGCHVRCTAAPFTFCAPSAGEMTSKAPAPQPAVVVKLETDEVERATVGQKRSDLATVAQ